MSSHKRAATHISFAIPPLPLPDFASPEPAFGRGAAAGGEGLVRKGSHLLSPRFAKPPMAPHKSPNPMSRLARKPPTHPEYVRLQLLGRGTTAEVWRVEKDGRYYALKEIKPKLAEDFRWEKHAVSLHAELCKDRHDNILAMLDSWDENGDTIFQVFELCSEPFDRWLNRSMPRPDFLLESVVWQFVRDVAAGLDCIHRYGMIHSDIKPSNVLVAQDSYGRNVFKIADFGLLCLDRAPKDEDKCGDPLYIAPECDLPRFELTQKADVFALGMSIFEAVFDVEMPTGELRRQIRTDPDAVIKLGCAINPRVSDELLSLLRRILDPDLHCRPTASEIFAVAQSVCSRLADEQSPRGLGQENDTFLSPTSHSCSPPRALPSSICSPEPPRESALRKRRERPRAIPFNSDALCSDDLDESTDDHPFDIAPSSPIPTRPRRRSISTPSPSVPRRVQRSSRSLFPE